MGGGCILAVIAVGLINTLVAWLLVRDVRDEAAELTALNDEALRCASELSNEVLAAFLRERKKYGRAGDEIGNLMGPAGEYNIARADLDRYKKTR